MKSVFAVLASVVLLFAAIWIIQGNDFFMYQVFAPKYEAARRNVFEQSKAYNQGMIQELDQMRLDYVKGTPEQKEAIASIVLHRTADYDVDKLPPYLQTFINSLRSEVSP